MTRPSGRPGTSAFPDDDIIIVGAAGRLSYRFPSPPGVAWTGFSVRLSESQGWRWNWNAPATQAQIHRVLAEPIRLDIRGEYRTGPDVGGLDNFVLTAGPPALVHGSGLAPVTCGEGVVLARPKFE